MLRPAPLQTDVASRAELARHAPVAVASEQLHESRNIDLPTNRTLSPARGATQLPARRATAIANKVRIIPDPHSDLKASVLGIYTAEGRRVKGYQADRNGRARRHDEYESAIVFAPGENHVLPIPAATRLRC